MKITVAQTETKAVSPHLLPAQIMHTGAAEVNIYFKPTQPQDANGQPSGPLKATFRGRQLVGEQMPLPEGYTGTVLQDTLAADIGDDEERRWVAKASFDKVTYWKHDELPQPSDPVRKALEWAALAEVLHADTPA